MEASDHLQVRDAMKVLLACYHILQPVLTKTFCDVPREFICVLVSLP